MAYSVYRPDIGYVQGMSYIAANIFYVIQNEVQAFKMFANLMSREALLDPFY